MIWRTVPPSRTTSWPPTRAEPDVGARMVVSILTRVDLPAPLGPRKPKIWPSGDLEVDAVHGAELTEVAVQG